MSRELREWIIGLPKAELHVHLEGTMTPATYARIARRNGFSVDGDPAGRFRCRDFDSFLRAFVDVVRVLKEPEDFGELASEYLRASAAAGVRHVEFFISPATACHFHPDADDRAIVEAVHGARRQAARDWRITSLVLIDIVRNLGEQAGLGDLALAQRYAGEGVTGIGLGGDERNFPARDFADVFRRASAHGLRRTVHAGEAAGAQSIIEAVELLGAERIGHCVAAAGNPTVIEFLRHRKVAIDASPTSNVVTGAVQTLAQHPLPEFLAGNLTVTLNTDDPAFFGASLVDEYENAASIGLDRAQLAQLAKNGFSASFATAEQKRRWIAEVDAYLAAMK